MDEQLLDQDWEEASGPILEEKKYLRVMVVARRAKNLSLMAQKELSLQAEEGSSSRPELAKVRSLTEEERDALKHHKPIIVAEEEIRHGKILWRLKSEKEQQEKA